jgi:hypothetical protein
MNFIYFIYLYIIILYLSLSLESAKHFPRITVVIHYRVRLPSHRLAFESTSKKISYRLPSTSLLDTKTKALDRVAINISNFETHLALACVLETLIDSSTDRFAVWRDIAQW